MRSRMILLAVLAWTAAGCGASAPAPETPSVPARNPYESTTPPVAVSTASDSVGSVPGSQIGRAHV